MILKVFVDSEDSQLKNKYNEHIKEHCAKLLKNINHIDAGFDLFVPTQQTMRDNCVQKLDFNIVCSAKIIELNGATHNTGYYMYPRSSISKSHLRLANNVGIIDAGYRGHLIGMFDVVYARDTEVNKFDRYIQICAPGLIPIVPQLVHSKEDLGEETARGAGGFGSTGI
jgi:dUTP pyrophosphatase